MANLPESSSFDEGVYQLELTDPVIGGPSGVSNAPLKNLANRTRWLKDAIASLASDIAAAFAPKASPTFTGNPTAPTPAQFDNDTSLATTEFVQRALGSRAGVKVINAAGSMDASYIGQLTFIQGTTYARTLPALSGLPDGATVEFMSVASGEVTLQCAGSDIINRSNSATNTSIKLNSGDTLALVKSGSYWNAVGGSKQLGAAAEFMVSLAGNGYQRLPTGMIIQWGSGSGVSASQVNVDQTFPIAFPNACLQIAASVGVDDTNLSQSSYRNDYSHINVSNGSKTGFTATIYLPVDNQNGRRLRYIAIGY